MILRLPVATKTTTTTAPLLAWLLLPLLLLFATTAQGQRTTSTPQTVSETPGQTSLASSTTATALSTSTTSAAPVDATSTPYVLTDSIQVRSTISITNDTTAPAFFSLPLSGENQTKPIFVALSLCTGPADGVVPDIPVNASSGTKTDYLESSLVRLYVSLSNSNQKPGPDSNPSSGSGDGDSAYAHGGFAQLAFNTGGSNDNTADGVWIGVWPPEWSWGVTGNFEIQIVVSTGAAMQELQNNYGIILDDTDAGAALVRSFNYSSGQAPNISLVVLPSSGQYSLTSIYYNSSFCAISDAWSSFANSDHPPKINSSETTRGSTKTYSIDDKRLQFEVQGLAPKTNYTAWLVNINSTDRNASGGIPGVSLYPGIKFVTKDTQLCRLVYDLDFCPEVAYSIPVSPEISTYEALQVINDTVSPNYANFSKTMSTWPCEDPYYGQYSSVRTCTDCKRSYQDWLCAVTMPRCTDAVENPLNESAAIPDITSLSGRSTGLNTQLLPYIINRNASTSRQKYFGGELGINSQYGEVLPCLYTCLFVQRNCPIPLLSWTCPAWDVTAQHDYGTFADAGSKGLGASENGGAGSDLARWGGPLRYIAQDTFGNVFCNALGVDEFLREQNAAPSLRPRQHATWTSLVSLVAGVVAVLLAVT